MRKTKLYGNIVVYKFKKSVKYYQGTGAVLFIQYDLQIHHYNIHMFKYCFTDTGKPTMNETSETSVQILFSHQWFTAAAQGFLNSYMVAPKNNY